MGNEYLKTHAHIGFKIDGRPQWMSAQSEGEYAKTLQNYYKAMCLEIDPYNRSYIPYNIGLIHISNGNMQKLWNTTSRH
jgi:hypothetical protein